MLGKESTTLFLLIFLYDIHSWIMNLNEKVRRHFLSQNLLISRNRVVIKSPFFISIFGALVLEN